MVKTLSVVLPKNMVKVRQLVGRGANDFLKLFNNHLVESQSKVWIKVIHPSSMVAGNVLDDVKNSGRNVTGSAAGNFVTGVCHLYEAASLEKENGSKESSYPRKNRVKLTGRKVNKFWKYSTIWSHVSNPLLGQQSRCFQHVFRVREHFVFIRKYSDSGIRSEPLYRTKTGYYDILGLSPSATQAQIKAAYYKKSFIYHPDKNAGSVDATFHFSVINEAYTVLGNKALRKKYDQRHLSLSDLTATTKHPSAKHRDTARGSTRQHAGGRWSVAGTDYQDVGAHFDKFYKSHYSKQLEKERLLRLRREELQRMKEETSEDKTLHVQLGILLSMGMVALILYTMV